MASEDGLRVQAGQVGLAFEERLRDQDGVAIDVSDAAVATNGRKIVLTPPGSTTGIAYDATPVSVADGAPAGDGTDGYIEYKTDSASIVNQVGYWKRQAVVTFADDSVFYGEVITFRVIANLATS